MKIGIDGSRAFIKRKTGIEEYSYQVIKNLGAWLKNDEVILYVRHDQIVDLNLPVNWRIKKLHFPRFWTQIRLSWEMIFNQVDVLFIPAHTVPFLHPVKTVVVVHGLEYEFCPQAFSFWERIYMRFFIKNSCRWASDVICVSENTKKDVMRLYKTPEKKIKVIYEGYSQLKDFQTTDKKFDFKSPYIFFIGRIEERKNVKGIVEAFEIFKQKYGTTVKLVLAGKQGYGYKDIKKRIELSDFKQEIFEIGYISESEKWELLKKSAIFIFPTFYEGFGLPILEAQSVMVPVITSNVSSIPEVAGRAVLYVDPLDYQLMAEHIQTLLSNESAKDDIIKNGYQNVKRFNWVDCAKEIATLLIDKK